MSEAEEEEEEEEEAVVEGVACATAATKSPEGDSAVTNTLRMSTGAPTGCGSNSSEACLLTDLTQICK